MKLKKVKMQSLDYRTFESELNVRSIIINENIVIGL